ncbi:MAG TPA: 4-hydroxythreonine-4-phosphate dehydrogenase PdxA, partial [Polyangiaceae bacterium]|jgi:4-hydroxythreonine-4-phosphate dehydrogenase
MSESLPVIIVTVGDPAGVGPEVVRKALADPAIIALARWRVIDQPAPPHITMGRLSAECGRVALEYVRQAVDLCLREEANAMVTAPINKEAVALSGEEFTGHTEFIAALCGAAESYMLLVNDRLSVIHVSTHRSLRSACELSPQRVLDTIRMGHQSLSWLGVPNGRIAVCGLNPHAGENGLFGDEDQKVIAPAVEAAQAEGIPCEGPLPPDTTFLKGVRGQYQMVVAMYHDQGHIPMKLLDFEHTVNVTLGLPIIRTSVDHGTAFDIAGRGLADAENMKAAMKLAVTMVRNRVAPSPISP